jgi:hypothetical protein
LLELDSKARFPVVFSEQLVKEKENLEQQIVGMQEARNERPD